MINITYYGVLQYELEKLIPDKKLMNEMKNYYNGRSLRALKILMIMRWSNHYVERYPRTKYNITNIGGETEPEYKCRYTYVCNSFAR